MTARLMGFSECDIALAGAEVPGHAEAPGITGSVSVSVRPERRLRRDGDQSLWMGNRERTQHERVGHGKDRRRRADAERQREERGDCHRWNRPKRANGEPHIPAEPLPHIASRLERVAFPLDRRRILSYFANICNAS